MIWKDLGNHQEVELVSYIKNYLVEKPMTKLYIGTDSQRRGKRVAYASVIVLYNDRKGGKVLYTKEIVPAIKDNFTRLFREIELSLEIGTKLVDGGIEQRLMNIDLDYNEDKKYFSNKLLTSALGWATSLGFTCRTKPNSFAASYCSDKLVKGLI